MTSDAVRALSDAHRALERVVEEGAQPTRVVVSRWMSRELAAVLDAAPKTRAGQVAGCGLVVPFKGAAIAVFVERVVLDREVRAFGVRLFGERVIVATEGRAA